MKRWSKAIKRFGILLIAGGIIALIVQTDIGLKYTNVGSSIHWVPPTPSKFDMVVLAILARSLVLAGIVFLVAGYM